MKLLCLLVAFVMILGIFWVYIQTGHYIQDNLDYDEATRKKYLTYLSVCNGIAITIANQTY